MAYRPGDNFYLEFCVNNSSGVTVNADSTPLGVLTRNGADDFTPKVFITNIDVGRYVASGTVPSTYSPYWSVGVGISGYVTGNLAKAFLGVGVLDPSLRDVNVVNVSGQPIAGPSISGSLIADLRYVAGNLVFPYNGIARSGAPTWIQLASSDSSTDNFYNYQYISLIGGQGQGQVAIVTAYSGTSKTAYVQTPYSNGQWLTNPYNDTQYSFIGLSTVALEFMQNQLVSSGAGVNFNTFFNDNGIQTAVTLDNISTTGVADWTTTERSQIRYRLGVDGFAVIPSTAKPAFTVATTGQINSCILGASGVELITVENGVNVRQLLAMLGAVIAGSSTVAGNNITYYAINNNATARIISTAVSGARNYQGIILP